MAINLFRSLLHGVFIFKNCRTKWQFHFVVPSKDRPFAPPKISRLFCFPYNMLILNEPARLVSSALHLKQRSDMTQSPQTKDKRKKNKKLFANLNDVISTCQGGVW